MDVRLSVLLKRNIDTIEEIDHKNKAKTVSLALERYQRAITEQITDLRSANPFVSIEDNVYNLLAAFSPAFRARSERPIDPTTHIDEIDTAWINFMNFFSDNGLRVNVERYVPSAGDSFYRIYVSLID